MRILATLIPPDSGQICYEDIDWKRNPIKARMLLGYLPQDFGCFRNITCFECLDYIGELKGISNRKMRITQIHDLLEQVNLSEHAKKKIKHLSGGMRRRLGIAQAMIGNPKIVMVDEPTAGLDPEERIRFRGLIRTLSQNKIVLISTHIVEDITATCDGVAVLNLGRLKSFNSISELAQYGKNKVWKCIVDISQYPTIEAKHRVISSNSLIDKIELRLFCDTKPDIDGTVSVEPGIEEGYLAWIGSQKEFS
jgi:ABC-2 type transport system ATP-binding protein